MDRGQLLKRISSTSVVIIVLALVAHASAGALRNAVADRVAQPARDQLAAWSGVHAIALDPTQWQTCYLALRRARAIAPNDADLALELGLVLRVRAQSSQSVPALAEALLGAAIDAFRDAVRLRPVSPFAWANIAYAQHLRLTSGTSLLPAPARAAAEAERSRALERALRYGPNEPAIRHIAKEIVRK